MTSSVLIISGCCKSVGDGCARIRSLKRHHNNKWNNGVGLKTSSFGFYNYTLTHQRRVSTESRIIKDKVSLKIKLQESLTQSRSQQICVKNKI